MLKALPGFALIELPKKYESGLTTEKEKYAMRSEGILREYILVADQEDYVPLDELAELYENARNKTVYFAPYEDGEVIKDEEKEYVYVAVRQLRGVKDAEA
jgi:hypothetical protein